jgi:hypothetical protein
MIRGAFVSTTLVLLAAFSTALQAQVAVEPSLQARMKAFGTAVESVDHARIATFFPRRGEWTLVRIIHRDGGMTDSIESRQVHARATRRMLAGVTEPDCGATPPPGDDELSFETLFPWSPEGGWRPRSPTRFEVPDDSASASRRFIAWRRESGRWVVSAMSDERVHYPRLLGVAAEGGRADPIVYPPASIPLAAESHVAMSEAWYEYHEPIVFMGHRYIKYGLPRMLQSGDVTRLGSYRRVGVYVETGVTGFLEVIYVPVTPTEFQPYQTTGVC